MFTRISRSWELVKASASVLAGDKELMLFPLVSTGVLLLVILSFALPVVGLNLFGLGGTRSHPSAVMYVVGFAFYFFAYSTWRGRPVLYLEDLFVQPEQRGNKIGLSLMKRLAALAVEHRCDRFVWQVLDWNQPAIDFYERIGARVERQWLTVRMEGDAIRALAES